MYPYVFVSAPGFYEMGTINSSTVAYYYYCIAVRTGLPQGRQTLS